MSSDPVQNILLDEEQKDRSGLYSFVLQFVLQGIWKDGLTRRMRDLGCREGTKVVRRMFAIYVPYRASGSCIPLKVELLEVAGQRPMVCDYWDNWRLVHTSRFNFKDVKRKSSFSHTSFQRVPSRMRC
ncbi:hypothetical protein AVEN_263030-1 [Araneus ventricosus]|uniref:Uncharacterized protein n=1 Tax=Araneus ventricosus TaxID=182803 RepID=A0A4Y2VID3_ARAVE|nr:hypothetical protein AVEN_263030-1 [Araneus ventricosus]